MVKQQRLRNFVFTWNNYTSDDEKKLQALPESLPIRYMVYGREKGSEEETPHLQGYVALRKQRDFNTIRKIFNKNHIEKRRGTEKQASDYCKKDNDFWEFGTISNPGKRTDIERLHESVLKGDSILSLWKSHPSMLKYYRGVREYQFAHLSNSKEFMKVTVDIYIGPAGCGKTKTAIERFPDIYWVVPGANGNVWWDGYTNQTAILFDDFYGWIKYGQLLRLLDGYRFQLPVKGGHTWKSWSNVIITSNKQPEEWYNKGITPALRRRINTITTFNEDSSYPPQIEQF